MSSEPYARALGGPTCDLSSNADVDGIAVAVANIIVNLCFRVMVTWSPENVDMGLQSLLFQIYPILLSTLLSINRQQLSTVDAHFAIAVSSSPLTVYLAVASIGDLFGIKTGLYKRIKSHRLVTRALGAMILPLWIGLSMTTSISGKAFKDSSCKDTGLTIWLMDIASLLLGFLMLPGLLGWFSGIFTPLIIYPPILFFLIKHRGQVAAGIRAHRKGVSTPWRWLLTPLMFVKCAWCVIDDNYKWFVYALFVNFDSGWVFWVINLSINATGAEYQMSYGQVSAVLAVVPTLCVTIKFVYSHRWDILNFLQRLPNRCLVRVRRCFTRKKPDPPAQDHHLPFNATPHPEKPADGKPPSQVAKNFRSTHRPPLSPELDYEMQGIRKGGHEIYYLWCGTGKHYSR